MSFEDPEVARASRAQKEAARESKKQARSNRKGRVATPEDELQSKIARIGEASGAVRATIHLGGAQVSEDSNASEPWRAPVAQIW